MRHPSTIGPPARTEARRRAGADQTTRRRCSHVDPRDREESRAVPLAHRGAVLHPHFNSSFGRTLTSTGPSPTGEEHASEATYWHQ
jgi:hypothetical protein